MYNIMECEKLGTHIIDPDTIENIGLIYNQGICIHCADHIELTNVSVMIVEHDTEPIQGRRTCLT